MNDLPEDMGDLPEDEGRAVDADVSAEVRGWVQLKKEMYWKFFIDTFAQYSLQKCI